MPNESHFHFFLLFNQKKCAIRLVETTTTTNSETFLKLIKFVTKKRECTRIRPGFVSLRSNKILYAYKAHTPYKKWWERKKKNGDNIIHFTRYNMFTKSLFIPQNRLLSLSTMCTYYALHKSLVSSWLNGKIILIYIRLLKSHSMHIMNVRTMSNKCLHWICFFFV